MRPTDSSGEADSHPIPPFEALVDYFNGGDQLEQFLERLAAKAVPGVASFEAASAGDATA